MCEEIMPHRKKAQKKTPHKTKHKHSFKPCIIEYMGERFDRGRGFVPDPKTTIESYCTTCGKRSRDVDSAIWYREEIVRHRWFCQPTEKLLRELDPKTRTLPTFWVDDFWKQKHVKLPDELEADRIE